MPASLQQRRNSASWAAVNRVLSVTMFSASHSDWRCRSKRGTDAACMAALYAGVLHSKRIFSFLPYCRFVVPVLSILQETCCFCNNFPQFFPQSVPFIGQKCPQSLAAQGLQGSCGFCVRECVRGRGRTQSFRLGFPPPLWGSDHGARSARPTPFPLRFLKRIVSFLSVVFWPAFSDPHLFRLNSTGFDF